MMSAEVLLAPGTQWSQRPIESLPAACAVRRYGAEISAADDNALAATNSRRESLLLDIALPPMWLVIFVLRLGRWRCWRRTRGPARRFEKRSDQNWRPVSRNQVGNSSRTIVASALR